MDLFYILPHKISIRPNLNPYLTKHDPFVPNLTSILTKINSAKS